MQCLFAAVFLEFGCLYFGMVMVCSAFSVLCRSADFGVQCLLVCEGEWWLIVWVAVGTLLDESFGTLFAVSV